VEPKGSYHICHIAGESGENNAPQRLEDDMRQYAMDLYLLVVWDYRMAE